MRFSNLLSFLARTPRLVGSFILLFLSFGPTQLMAQDSLFVTGAIANLKGRPLSIDISVELSSRRFLTSTVKFDTNGFFEESFELPIREIPVSVTGKFFDCEQQAQEVASPRPYIIDRTTDYGADLTLKYCKDDTTMNGECRAFFTVRQALTSNNRMIPNELIVYENSLGSGLSHSWQFGDGDSTNLRTPRHSYLRNGPYELCLTVRDTFNCSNTFCDTIQVDTSGILSAKRAGFSITVLNGDPPSAIDPFTEVQEAKLYPNPTYGFSAVKIKTTESGPCRVAVYSVSGQLILEQVQPLVNGENNILLDLTSLKIGAYWVRISSEHGVWTGPILKK